MCVGRGKGGRGGEGLGNGGVEGRTGVAVHMHCRKKGFVPLYIGSVASSLQRSYAENNVSYVTPVLQRLKAGGHPML